MGDIIMMAVHRVMVCILGTSSYRCACMCADIHACMVVSMVFFAKEY